MPLNAVWLSLLARIGQRLVMEPEPSVPVLQEIFHDVAATLGFEIFFHYQLAAEPQTLEMRACTGLPTAQHAEFQRIRFGEFLCGRVAQERRPLVVEDLGRSTLPEAARLREAGVRCYAGYPMQAEGRLLGTLALASGSRDALHPGEHAVIQAVCDQASVQIARAQAAQALRDRERHLRLVLDASQAIAFEWDIATDRVRRGGRAARDLPLAEVDGQTLAQLRAHIHPPDVPGFDAALAAALADPPGQYACEYRVLLPDGRLRWLGERGQVEFDAAGRPCCLRGIAIDIDERKQAQEQLRLAAGRFEAALQASPVAVFNQDLSLRYTWIHNPAQPDIAARVLGRTDADLLRDPDELAALTAVKREALLTGRTQRADVRVTQDAESRVWDLTVRQQLDADGRVVGITCAAVDVTAQRARDAELRRAHSERLFSRLAERAAVSATEIVSWAPALLYVYDVRERRSVFRNRPLGELLGHPPPSPELPDPWRDIEWRRLMHPDDQERLELHRERLTRLRVGESALFTCRMRAADGQWRWIQSRDVALPSAARAGEPTGFIVGTAADITEQKTAEAARAAGEARYRQMFEANPMPMWVYDEHSLRFLAVNDAAVALYGWSREQFLALSVPDLRLPQDAAALRRRLESGAGDAVRLPRRGTTRHRRRDGTAMDVEITSHPFEFDGRPTRLVLALDVTARLRAEDALRDSEERLRLSMQAAGAGSWDWDLAAQRVVWSPENFALYDLDPVDAGPDYAAWSERLHPDDRAATQAAVRDALEGRAAEFRHEFRVLRRDGSERWLQGIGRVRRDAAGRAVRMSGINLDITERKRLDALLRDEGRRKDEFLAMLAHELRNPLAPIRTTAGILRARAGDDPVLQRCRDIVERQTAQMARLLDDLLDVSRLSRGVVTLRREPMALAEALEAAVETARPLFDQRGQTLHVSAPGPDVRVDGDAARLTQVFANLLNNAAKYSHGGGTVDLDGAVEGAEAVVTVRDRGIGIDAALLPSVFDLFVQGDGARAQAPSGLGIGLSLARRLVQMHGGSVQAHSAGPGQGSTFTVRLPLLQAAGTAPAEGASPAAAPADAVLGTLPQAPERAEAVVERMTQGEVRSPQGADTLSNAWTASTASTAGIPTTPADPPRVLVVDDNVDAADTTAMLLGGLGCEARAVYDGAAAVDGAVAWRPALVVLDLGMRDMDGFEAARRIRAAARAAGVPAPALVALSGWGQEEDRRRSAEAGFDLHLTKPAAPAALQEAVAFAARRAGAGAVRGTISA